MDVILDSNRYLADPRMAGNSFANLFDYLRRTGSELVVPRIVFDEVITRYEEILKKNLDAVKSTLVAFNRLSFTDAKLLPVPEIGREVKELKARIEKPTDRVKVTIQEELSSVSLAEVVKRQIHRIAPASKAGEQFRDVVVWLSVIGYSASTKPPKAVAFITDDSGFWSGESLDESLREEISGTSTAVSVFRKIDDFIKQQALAPTSASKEWEKKYVNRDSIEDIAVIQSVNYLSRTLGRELHLVSGTAQDVEFSDGAIYEVGPQSQFAELDYSFAASIEVEERSVQSIVYNKLFPQGKSFVSYGPEYQTPILQTPTAIPRLMYEWGGAIGNETPASFNVLGAYATPTSYSRSFLARGTVRISLRVVQGKESQAEFEGFKDIDFTESDFEAGREPKPGALI